LYKSIRSFSLFLDCLFFFFSPSFFFISFCFLADQVPKMFSFLFFHFPFSNFLFNQVYKRTFNGLPLNRKKETNRKKGNRKIPSKIIQNTGSKQKEKKERNRKKTLNQKKTKLTKTPSHKPLQHIVPPQNHHHNHRTTTTINQPPNPKPKNPPQKKHFKTQKKKQPGRPPLYTTLFTEFPYLLGAANP